MGQDNRVHDLDSDDLDGKYGRQRQHDPEFRGPIRNRSCTDILCLLLFLAFIAGWVVVAVYAFQKGNPKRLVYPSNSKGEICGQGDYAQKPFLLFFDLSKCANPTVIFSGCPTPQVCVDKCPDELGTPLDPTDPTPKNAMREYCVPEVTDAIFDSNTASELADLNLCPPWWVPSRSLLKRCIPSFSSWNGQDMQNDTTIIPAESTQEGQPEVSAGLLKVAVDKIGEFLNLRSLSEKLISDLGESWWIVLLGLLLATAVAFLWIVLMRFIAGVMIWASLILSVCLLVLSSVYCYMKYDKLKDVPEAQGSWFDQGLTTNLDAYTSLSVTWLVFFIISVVALVIILIILIFLRTRIRIAIELIEEGSLAVGDMMSTLFFPVVPFLMQIVFIAWFIVVAMYLGSIGEATYMVDKDTCPPLINKYGDSLECDDQDTPPKECPEDARCIFYKYGATDEAQYMQLYNLFGLLWGLFFLSALGEMVLAGAFASWYFTMDKKHNLPRSPLLSSFYRAFRYHLGTLAFGSLIIAIIRFIRIMIEYVEQKLKQYRQDNPFVKAVLCMCRCCFWCLEKFMRFINRNAYIMTAIYGENFCSSAREAFSLLMRNFARVFVLDKVTDFLLLLGKLVIVGGIGLLSFYVFSGRIDYVDFDELNYYFVPIILITLGSYFIADVFFGVYEMAVDTLFLCFLEDIERNDGSAEKPYYMSRDLRKILGYMENKTPETPNSRATTASPR